jgi:hypothetical protein
VVGRSRKRTPGGEIQGNGWKVRGPKLKLRHVAVLRSGQWMGRRANTRVPAFLMIVGYPATLVIVLFSPLVVTGVGLLAALVVWHVSYRSVVRPGEHATKARMSVAADWATRVTALLPAYLVWVLLVRWHTDPGIGGLSGFARRVKALFSTVFDGRWFLGYATASVLAWLLIFRAPHVVSRHHARKEAEGSPFTADLGFEGAKVLSKKATRVGERYVISIARTGKAVSEFLSAATKEKLAAKFSLPASRVIVSPVATNAGHLEVAIRRSDPWADELTHPGAPAFKRHRRKIGQPIVLGMEPEDGTVLKLSLATKEGGQHIVVIAGSGGGKTTLINSVLEHLTDCADTDVAMIDVTKGKDGRAWSPAVAEAHMGPEATGAALECLERHCRLIETRAASNRNAVWKAGTKPADRAKVIIFDEASALLASTDRSVSERAKAAVSYIIGKGRSEMVILIVMSQRGVLAHLGTGDVAANTFTKIMLGVSKRGEMLHVIPDWQDQGMPDMSTYGEGKKGIVLISPVGQRWSAGRTWNLSDLDTIRRIAADRVIRDDAHLAILEAETAYSRTHPDPVPDPGTGDEATLAALDFDCDPDLLREPPDDGVDDPDDPDNVPGAAWGSPDTDPRPKAPITPKQPRPRELTEREKRMMATFGQPSTPGGGWRPPPIPAEVKAVKDLADATASAVSVADHALAVELARPAQESARRWADRERATVMADQDKSVPADFATTVFRLIDRDGWTTRPAVVAETGLGKIVVAERLRVMTSQGQLARQGGRYTRV